MADTKIIDRIRKLMAMATSANEAEAAAFAGKAQALLAEHNLSLDDIKGEEDDELGMDISTLTDAYPWRRPLADAVARMYFCSYAYGETLKGRTKYDVHGFVGRKHNVEVAKLMFDYLWRAIDRMARDAAKKLPKKQQSPFRVSFRWGASRRLVDRIEERIGAAKSGLLIADSGSRLPALIDKYDAADAENTSALDAMAEVQQVPAAKPNILDPIGGIAGMLAGGEIGLDTQIAGAGPAKKIAAR
jgi:hypothetical protein